MSLTNPYKNIKQHTRISLDASHMNSNIKDNLLTILKKKIEKKCNKSGFIDEIFRLLEFSDGIMCPENLSGNALYNIIYYCRICIPIENTINVALIRTVNLELIIAMNGPIVYFITKDNINEENWTKSESYYDKKTKKKLDVGMYVKIRILSKRINYNDTQIKIIGEMLDFASDDEISNYFGSGN